MNNAKCHEYDTINFLVATQTVFSIIEAAHNHPKREKDVAYDAYMRLLQHIPRIVPHSGNAVKPFVKRQQGIWLDQSISDSRSKWRRGILGD